MKKLLAIAVCASAVAAFADLEPTTLGTVGVTAITSTLTNTVVAVSYKDLAEAGNIAVSNIVKTTNLLEGDRLYVFNNGSYQVYKLSSNGGYWQKMTNAEVGSTGGLTITEGVAANSKLLAVGQGIWLVRGPKWDGEEFTFYIYGKPANSNTVPVSSGTNLVGNPTTSNVAPTVANPSDGDRVLVPQNFALPITYTYNETKKQWSHTGSDHKKVFGALPEIKAGTGFWYVAKGEVTTITFESN